MFGFGFWNNIIELVIMVFKGVAAKSECQSEPAYQNVISRRLILQSYF